MKKIAVFPGSFDPLTLGHESVILRALPLFDEIVVAIGHNQQKHGLFSVEQRKLFIEKLYENEPRVKVADYTCLTVDFCKQIGANFLLRGLRTSADFEYERMIALTNKTLQPQIETVLLLTESKYSFLTSSIVRDILRYKGDVSEFVPSPICKMILTL